MTLSYILQFFGIIVLMAPVYILSRWLMLQKQKKINRVDKKAMYREIFLGLFFLYVIGLLALALVIGAEYGSPSYALQKVRERLQTGERMNLVPFRTIASFWQRSHSGDVFLVNIVGNIIMFVPWGFGLPLLWEKNRTMGRMMFWSAMLPLFIEIWQLFVGRSVDVDDWILNFVGSMLGGLLYLGLKQVKRKKR